MILALAAGLTVITAATVSGSPQTWTCAYVAERLPRALLVRGDDALSAEETRAARQTLSLADAILTRASSITLARELGASRVVVVRCLDNRETTIEAQAFDVHLPIAGPPVRVTRPRADVVAAIDEIAHRLASNSPGGDYGFRGPSEPALNKAGLALNAESPLERARGLTEALAADPGSIDLRLSAVEALIAARDFETAERLGSAPPGRGVAPLLTRALRFLTGVAHLEGGRYAAAEGTFEELRRDRETGAVLNNLGVARFRRREPEASSFFSRAESLPDPRRSEIEFNRSLAQIFEGKADLALPSLKVPGDSGNPGDARVRLLRVWALRMLNRETERSEEWERLVTLFPSFSSLGQPDLARRLERILLSERTSIFPQPGTW